MDADIKIQLLTHLMGLLTENRQALFHRNIEFRTKHICVVLEDIYQPHNASAVLRSCDLTGIQDIHVIENKNTYEPNPEVAMGSYKWVSLIKHNEGQNRTLDTYKRLRENGYKIVATSPHKEGYNLEDIPLDEKMAIVWGTELNGLSDEALENADSHLRIPMYGFTESFNISVSAAIILFHLTEKLRRSKIKWQLTEADKIDILLDWTRNTLKKPDILEKEFLKMLNSQV